MAQTHSAFLTLQVNFEYPEDTMRHGRAIREAVRQLLNPETDKGKQVRVTGISLSIPETDETVGEWGDV